MADAIERTQRFPEPLLSDLHDSRLLRLLLPRSVSGEEVSPGEYLEAVAELARHDGSVAWNVFVANSAALIAPFLAAVEICDMTYRAAGVSAIFVGSPFERRFRDIHRLSQQIQSRLAHFRSVGQVLLGSPPAVFY